MFFFVTITVVSAVLSITKKPWRISETPDIKSFRALLGVAFVFAVAIGSAGPTRAQAAPQRESDELERYRTAERIGQDHLKKFDTLDFDIYTNQKWEVSRKITALTS
jgi:hypothetical protein